MIRFTAETTISRSADEIWAVATDIGRHTEWMAVTESTMVSGAGTERGSRARQTMRFGPFTFRYELEVIRADPARAVAWRMIGNRSIDGGATLELTRLSPDSTRVVYSGTLSLHGLLRLFEPIAAAEARSGEERELMRLKELVEASPSAVAASA